LVTYPSTYEGFGNALLEAVYFKRPVIVNRYPVYNADIRPLGFEFIEIDGFVDDSCVDRAHELLRNGGAKDGAVREVAEKNYQIAQEHFSLEVLEKKLKELLTNFR
jgi:glycosyltransferase involved in cell wall biosynthesis